MTSSADRLVGLLLLLASGTGFSRAQDSGSAGAPVAVSDVVTASASSEAFTSRAVDALAREWGVQPARLHVNWSGTLPEPVPSESASVRLFGRGRDGWVVVQFESPLSPDIAMRARVAVDESVTVATRALAPGASLAPADLRREVRAHWGLRETPEPRVEAGWIVRRALAAGDIVNAAAAEPPNVIRNGESVKWSWQNGGVRVTTPAVAIGSAALGGRVSVRLADGSVRRDGIAEGRGMVVTRTGGEP